ncbi:MAG: response regulator transcription factor [Bacteroidales bacterium]|nr:response regulator transcription factor [Bacteroidales bacterium]
MLELKILLAEHDKDLASITKNYLVTCGYPTQICLDGESALQLFRKEQFDFVLIDADISVISSIDLAREIRQKNRFIPIVFIGTNPHQNEIIKAFNNGADDFLARPFSMEELGLRIKAIQKRAKNTENKLHYLSIGNCTLDTLHNVLSYNGKEKKLTSKELDLLCLLLEYKNRVVERSLALKRVWHSDNYFNARNMDVYVKRLRNILREDPSLKLENVHGVGYRLVIQPF